MGLASVGSARLRVGLESVRCAIVMWDQQVCDCQTENCVKLASDE